MDLELKNFIPILYDYNTLIRSLPKSYYAKIGMFYIGWIYGNNINYSGITTMIQIRNIPFEVLGGIIYMGGLIDPTRVIQPSDDKIYPRPNVISSHFVDSINSGITYITIIGK